jgi:lysophospholipid acyltransferase (LPLAT)-like uncharacterized protein
MSTPRLSLRDRVTILLVGFFGAFVLRALNRTLRWRTVVANERLREWPQGQPCILAFWHGHQLLMPWVYLVFKNADGRPIYALISHHTDGRMVARAMAYLGVRSVAGSSSHGGRAAVNQLVECVLAGNHIAITPDGPKGPIYRSKTGAVRIAERTGAAILPCAIGAERRWTFGSWDRMFLPQPGSRVVRILGEPFTVPRELDEAGVVEWSRRLDEALDAVRLQAETFDFGSV